MTAAGLEARYRRLLRWYPAGHRAVHDQEMLGVLMSGSRPDQDWPGLAESANLVLGALRIRIRPGRTLSDRDGWRDALAVFSVAAPLLAFAAALVPWLVTYLISQGPGGLQIGQAGLTFNFSIAHPLIGTAIWLAVSGQGLVVLLVLAGQRRLAVLAEALYLVYFGIIPAGQILFRPPAVPGIAMALLQVPFALVIPIMELVALLASAGPRRGRSLLRPRQWAVLGAAALAFGALAVPVTLPIRTHAMNVLQLAGAVIFLLVLAAAWLSSAFWKRLTVLLALLAFPGALALAPSWWFRSDVPVAASELAVICCLAALVYSTRRRSRSGRDGEAGAA
jgi:hypothetical protein